MANGTFETLKTFRYGSVSNPRTMTGGNKNISAKNYSEKNLTKWEKLGWIKWNKDGEIL
jgi:hypothetical protein